MQASNQLGSLNVGVNFGHLITLDCDKETVIDDWRNHYYIFLNVTLVPAGSQIPRK